MARLEVRNLVKVYRRRTVVKGVSFDVSSGEIVGLLGPNGAGKTTTFRMAIGMVRPRSGLVFLNGHNVTRLAMHRRARRGLGYLAQEPTIFRKLTVEQNLVAVLELRRVSSDEIRYRTEALLEEFNLYTVRTQRAGTLSGGERRRLEIARALSTQPQIMLLDEPIYGVDPLGVQEIIGLVRDLKSRGIGILITEHNVQQVLSLVDRAYVIHEGQVIFSGSPEELVTDDLVREHYLGEQFTIADLVPKRLIPEPEPLAPKDTEEMVRDLIAIGVRTSDSLSDVDDDFESVIAEPTRIGAESAELVPVAPDTERLRVVVRAPANDPPSPADFDDPIASPKTGRIPARPSAPPPDDESSPDTSLNGDDDSGGEPEPASDPEHEPRRH